MIVAASIGFIVGFLVAAVVIGGVMIAIHRGLSAENRELRIDNETLRTANANAREVATAAAANTVNAEPLKRRPRTMWDEPEPIRGPHGHN